MVAEGDGAVAQSGSEASHSTSSPRIVVERDAKGFYDDAADVVVVGFGCAGASAALQANELGGDVLVVDRFDGGGATRYSGGIYYAGNTKYQKQAGFEDSVEEMYKYLSLDVRDAVKPETLRRFCETSSESIEWLGAHGVPFESSAFTGKRVFPPDGKHLYYSGNEKVPSYMTVAKPAPRGHRAVGKGNFCGYAFFDALRSSIEQSPIRVQTHSRVDALIVNGEGRVVGVEMLVLENEADQRTHQKLYRKVNPHQPFGAMKAERAIARARKLEDGKSVRKRVRAERGVVLSTGGFVYNLDMMRENLPVLANTFKTMMRLGSMGCDGSGIQLGRAAGGATGYMQRPFVSQLLNPPDAKTEGILVNAQGQRFVNEDVYCSVLGDRIIEQPKAMAWLLLDNTTFRRVVQQSISNKEGTRKLFGLPTLLNMMFGKMKVAKSLDRLGRKLKMPAGALDVTVAKFNRDCREGRADAQGKNPDYVRPLGEGPYWALDLSLHNTFAFNSCFSLGGLKVDEERGLVLRENGSAIEGLYAAGRAAVGICSDGYFSGLSLADGVFSGRRAAYDAMERHSKTDRDEKLTA